MSSSTEVGGSQSRQLSDRYLPQEVEARHYQNWEEKGYFRSVDVSTAPPFSVILPPPNVTGSLHMGHALDHTIQDVLVRWKRMSGYNTMWLPGTDHAGIATQNVVERELGKQGQTRQELGRDEFVKRVWQWKEQYGNRITSQMRRLGDSCDWDRHTFTLDEGVSRAVRKVFSDLYKKGWIYRGSRLINWSPKLESAISDLEVEHQDVKGHLWHLKYPVDGQSGRFLVVATTRPETMLGDLAVAVHPEDKRYQDLLGQKVKLPLTNRKISIIADSHVDREFGTGAVKITPAHDFNDYEMGLRHNLGFLNILNPDGTLNENAGAYQGLSTAKAREKIVADLDAQGFLEKVEPHQHSVGHCSRSGCVVEPYLSDQWFVKAEELAVPARRVVESETITFEPESWTKTYLHWMNNIQDWCISRQLWWGHRIPAWYCQDCGHITVSEEDPSECESCDSKNIKQDEDVLDTWFSSGLWPFSTMGWPDVTETQKTFYPTDVLVTGHDIIFFWVARMIMMGLEFTGDVPFRKVYIHGLIRDSQGRKMSKSLNNSVDPVEIIDKHGADALRFTLMAQIASGRDLKFSEQRLEGYRNFMNKVWNATRFSMTALSDFEGDLSAEPVPNKLHLSDADQWIVYKLGKCERDVHEALSQYRFSDAAGSIYSFIWHEFCDWYLEFIKPIIYGDKAEERRATQKVLFETLNRAIKLLHPFAPFITEEIFQTLNSTDKTVMLERYPTTKNDKSWLAIGSEAAAFEMDVVRETITAIRNIRGENRIKPGEKIAVRLAPESDKGQKILGANKLYIMTMSRLDSCEIGEPGNLAKCAVSPVYLGDVRLDVIVPLEGLVDIEEEVKRLEKKIEKLEKEKAGLDKRLANENFVKNAPEEVVIEGREQLKTLDAQITILQASLERLR
ncbi:MAG: valine--tRNA ligase [Pseudobdellovibrionaceae bacterium]|nr:MAG: valine--tRNA ligase [Pseudobdellovibrionaceae bacterium]